MKKISKHIVDLVKLSSAMAVAPICRLFNKKNIYLVGERKDQCQDNGYHLFKYVREYHKDDKFYYCITRESKQLNKIKDLDNIVYYKSFKHYLYYVLANKLVCAHVGSCTPDSAVIWKAEARNIINKNRVFIQHGITTATLPQLMYPNVKFSTFVCGAKPEYEFIRDTFGFPNGVIKYLGLCRFDNLHNFKVKNQILIMPTWRQWFGMDGNNTLSDDEFLKSDYFIKFNELINSIELDNYLEVNGMEAVFYPHNETQRYLHLFKSNCKNIIIASKDRFDVQNLLKESKLLITDYSSIAFDFAYMKKPIIYYQFDDDEYYKNHYEKGYFDYERDGFGPIGKDINQILNLLENDNSKFIDRVNKFFELNDKNNCERNYKAIIE